MQRKGSHVSWIFPSRQPTWGYLTSAPVAQESICRYTQVYPPSITRSAPVMNEDSSLARNKAPLAISSGWPSRPIGCSGTSALRAASMLP